MVKSRPRGPRQDSKHLERRAADHSSGGASTGGGSTAGDEGDAGIFRAAVRDVKPLAPTGRSSVGVGTAPKTRARRATLAGAERESGAVRESAAELALLPDTIAPEDAVGGSDPLSFRRPGVRDQVMRRLRRGLYPVQDELDLHGLNQAAARDRLSDFLEYNRNAARRCVRIVHGKGYRSGARGPILKIAVNAWLRRHPDVMAFTSARAIDGGTGAVYVLLRA
jgi:DNA-nicking Smr family endonuclease